MASPPTRAAPGLNTELAGYGTCSAVMIGIVGDAREQHRSADGRHALAATWTALGRFERPTTRDRYAISPTHTFQLYIEPKRMSAAYCTSQEGDILIFFYVPGTPAGARVPRHSGCPACARRLPGWAG